MINIVTALKLPGVKKFARGAVIAAAGKVGEMHILVHGSAATFKNPHPEPENQLAYYNAGDFFGELSLFLSKALEGHTIAMTDVIVLTVTRENMSEIFTKQLDLCYSVMVGLCRKIDDATALSQSQAGQPDQKMSVASPLFPEGHGSYLLNMNNQCDCLYEQKTTCPLCSYSFTNLIVIASRLRRDSNDGDRVRYKDVEPMHYEIATCPNCLYSAQSTTFGDISKKARQRVEQELAPYKEQKLQIMSGTQRDTFTVFAGYYLALLCAPISVDDHQLVTGSLWQKLSRLYQDCEDEKMSDYASDQAMKEYLYAYQNLYISERQSQQLCCVLGELHLKKGNIDEARNFFYLAKTNTAGTGVMKRQAERRLDDIKEMQLKEREKQKG